MLDVTGWRRYLPITRGDLADAITTIEGLIMSAVDDLTARIDAATNEIAGEIRAAKDAALAAVANHDADVQAAVEQALAGLDAPVSRLEALGRDNADPVPAPPVEGDPTPAEPVDGVPTDGPVA